jgi:phosphonoacetate hydrolase
MPSFTNPNNLSIVTGLPPAGHGIAGNTTYDATLDRELPTTDPKLVCAPTIFETLGAEGLRTVAVTTKDKLRALLGAMRGPGESPLTLSVEGARRPAPAGLGVSTAAELVDAPPPDIYAPEASLYAFDLALAAATRTGARFVYVSTTDYVQHKAPPGSELASAFYAGVDRALGRYLERGFGFVLTADHGMNDKTLPDGSPNVRYLGDVLTAAGLGDARVVLPITDPYVVHHGALGSAAFVHLAEPQRARAAEVLVNLPGVERVLSRADAARLYALPPGPLGDLVIFGDARTVLGKTAAAHDLSAVRRGLRSHGGLGERVVPLVCSEPRRLRPGLTNADALEVAFARPP